MAKKKARMGRPPIPEKMRRGRIVGVRFTQQEYKLLAQDAKSQGCTVAELLRNLWLESGGE